MRKCTRKQVLQCAVYELTFSRWGKVIQPSFGVVVCSVSFVKPTRFRTKVSLIKPTTLKTKLPFIKPSRLKTMVSFIKPTRFRTMVSCMLEPCHSLAHFLHPSSSCHESPDDLHDVERSLQLRTWLNKDIDGNRDALMHDHGSSRAQQSTR